VCGAKLSNSGETIKAEQYQVNKSNLLMDHGKTLVYGNNLFRFGNPEPSFSPEKKVQRLDGSWEFLGGELLKIKSRP